MQLRRDLRLIRRELRTRQQSRVNTLPGQLLPKVVVKLPLRAWSRTHRRAQRFLENLMNTIVLATSRIVTIILRPFWPVSMPCCRRPALRYAIIMMVVLNRESAGLDPRFSADEGGGVGTASLQSVSDNMSAHKGKSSGLTRRTYPCCV